MATLVTLPNGVNESWINLSVILFGVPLIGITKLTVTANQAKENNYGMGAEPVSRGYGRKEYSGSMTVYLDEIKKILSASPNRNLLDIPMFDIPLLFASSRTSPYKVVLKAVEFMSNGIDTTEGDTKILTEIPLVIGGIQW
jgi:hypothetical protein